MKCLPHPITIAKWHRNLECTSSIIKAALDTILKVNQMKEADEKYPVPTVQSSHGRDENKKID